MDRKIKNIIIHNSDSEWGDRNVIDKWHKERGWKGIGYHYVILNDFPTYSSYKSKERQGTLGFIEKGRPDEETGAHTRGMNYTSLGICLIGKEEFKRHQRFCAVKLVCKLMKAYNLKVTDIMGHCETESGKEQGKTCPNLDMGKFRRIIIWIMRLDKIIHII